MLQPSTVRILQALPPTIPVLATTATANNRVVRDIQAQLGANLTIIRGQLTRPSLKLQTISLPNQAARLAWLAQHLLSMPGSGIIYSLTKRDAEQVAGWLRTQGIAAEAYTSDSANRENLEEQLLNNQLKALVATSALGMGFDKPDLGFVIHYQRPGSVVHYYQQVGRAGRAIANAYGILLSGSEDESIVDYFIRSALLNYLQKPRKTQTEIAKFLKVPREQAKVWLNTAIDMELVEKSKRGYVVRVQDSLL